MLTLIRHYMPDITFVELICFDWDVEGTAAELPLLWVTALSLSYVWERRRLGRPVLFTECKAELTAQRHIARGTRLFNTATVFEDLISDFSL